MRLILIFLVLSVFCAVQANKHFDLVCGVKISNLVEKLTKRWARKHELLSSVAFIDIGAEAFMAKRVARQMPTDYSVFFPQNSSSKEAFGKAAFIIVFVDVYKTVS